MENMVSSVTPKQIESLKELLITSIIQIDTVTQLLIDKGVFTGEEYYHKLKHIQADYSRQKNN